MDSAESISEELFAWTFADRVRKARKVARMTQAQLADAIGVKEGTVAGWEANNSHPRGRDYQPVCKRISLATGAPIQWMLGWDEGSLSAFRWNRGYDFDDLLLDADQEHDDDIHAARRHVLTLVP